MKYLLWLLKAAIFFTLFAFALNNQHDATVYFFFGTYWRAPLVLVVLAAFAGGLVVGALGMGAGALLAVLFAWYSARLAFQSYDFHDISTGNDATPLWLPQLSMAIGALVFAIAAFDEFVIEWRGRPAKPVETEALRHE